MTSLSDRLRVLLGLCEKATPGPWGRDGDHYSHGVRGRPPEGAIVVTWDDHKPQTDADAAFIAAASPPAVAALCEVAEAALAVQAARDLEQPKHFAEFVAVLDVERAALARLAECLPEGDQQ